jgi:putative transposase
VRMASEIPTWGYTRIQGALKNLGHQVARSTISKILKAQGVPPTGERPTSWDTFLRAHWDAIAGADFFTTEIWTLRGLVTYYTLFVIELVPTIKLIRIRELLATRSHDASGPPRQHRVTNCVA